MIATKKTIICDQCKKQHQRGEADWIQVRIYPDVPGSYNGSGIGAMPCGEYCSVECLQKYLELYLKLELHGA